VGRKKEQDLFIFHAKVHKEILYMQRGVFKGIRQTKISKMKFTLNQVTSKVNKYIQATV